MDTAKIMTYLNEHRIENVEIKELPALEGLSREELDDLYNRLTQKKNEYEYNHREELKKLDEIEKLISQEIQNTEKSIASEQGKLDTLLRYEYGFLPQEEEE